MIQIHNELSIDNGDDAEPDITLWLISYYPLSPAMRKRIHAFVETLGDWCLSHGWQLEAGDDPYREASLWHGDGAFAHPSDDVDWLADLEGD